MDTTLQDTLVGREIDGRYQVQSRIARGGMATVYLALDRRLERDVALKVMHDHLADDPEFVARFVREARAAARLTSPNVVQVFDQGSDGDILYLAMEYLPGRTLRDVLTERGALTPRETLSVLGPVLEALASAHRAGIVHRDVKPENIVLTDDGRIKVADFGLARALAAPISGSGSDSRLLGTVSYLAPELVSRGVSDSRADVYAAGIVLFETLTGRLPYTGDDPVAVAYRHVHERVPAPSAVVPGLPSDLDDLVLSTTNPDPDRRPADGEDMLERVRGLAMSLPDHVLDARAFAPREGDSADDATQVMAAQTATQAMTASPATQAVAAPAPVPHQETRALNLPARAGSQLVPRLRVHEDDDAVDLGWFGGRRRNQGFALVGAAIAVLLVLGVCGWWFVGGPGAKTEVPGGLVGQRVSDAQRLLAARGLSGTSQEAFDSKIAKGQVVRTEPPAGEKIDNGGTVVLIVSKGPEQIAIPSLAGRSPQDAEKVLTGLGLTVGDSISRFSDKVESGKVIGTSPKAETLVTPGREIGLVVSKGPEPIEMPDVKGKSRDEATQILTRAGLEVKYTDVQPGVFGPFPGQVAAQDPQPGTKLKKGDDVTISVATGIFGQPQQVQVPDVNRWQVKDAERVLKEQGFKVNIQGGGNGQGNGQNVFGQNPPAGSQVPVGSEITLFVGNF